MVRWSARTCTDDRATSTGQDLGSAIGVRALSVRETPDNLDKIARMLERVRRGIRGAAVVPASLSKS